MSKSKEDERSTMQVLKANQGNGVDIIIIIISH
jgi:hypothetical protein